MDQVLRLATDDDVDDLCAIDYDLFPENNFNECTLRAEMRVSMCWIVRVRDVLAAYVLCRVTHEMVDILRLGVRQPFRRHGLGRLLLRTAMSARPQSILTVRKSNTPALQLYLNHGFEIIGHMPQHDCWAMSFRMKACG